MLSGSIWIKMRENQLDDSCLQWRPISASEKIIVNGAIRTRGRLIEMEAIKKIRFYQGEYC